MCDAVRLAESSLKHKDIVGTTNTGREGLGTRQRQRWEEADRAERRSLVQDEIRKEEEQARSARAVQIGPQGNWTKWNLPDRKVTWHELWNYEPLQLSFLLRSVYDLLPSPTNLQLWKLSDDPTCPLCDKPGSMRHILSSCSIGLSQGRYRWRHDRVLGELAHVLEKERKRKRTNKKSTQYINFVREGEKSSTTSTRTGILDESGSWEMKVDLGKKLHFPEEVVHTTLRPDIVIWSKIPKRVILVELTVPYEERSDEAFELKKAKYQELVQMCQDKGWRTWNFPVEVGCRGFPSQSVWRMFGALGIRGNARKAAVQALAKASERASSWLWIQRSKLEWKPT